MAFLGSKIAFEAFVRRTKAELAFGINGERF
jgi:hypothetical protein